MHKTFAQCCFFLWSQEMTGSHFAGNVTVAGAKQTKTVKEALFKMNFCAFVLQYKRCY